MASAVPPALRFAPLANTREAIERLPVLRQLLPARAESVRLVLLCAPAGFGKTTLLAQLAQAARAEGSRVAWLNCDARDRDAAVFAGNLAQALCHGGVGQAGIDDLAQVEAPLLICIDDFEAASGAQADALIGQMALLASPQVRIVVAGREPPRLPLTRMLLDGRARQVDAQLLRFTGEEARRLLQPAVAADSVEQIAQYADGWPFALQLARLRAQAAPAADWPGDAGAPIPRRQIFDYLAREVIGGLPPVLRDFLADVAVLDLVDADAANALREREDGLALIQQLMRIRPVVLVDEGGWSARLHPLLRDYLLDAGRQSGPGRVARLHQRAARHLASRGQLHEAVAHAVAGRNPGLGAQLMEQAGGLLLMASEGAVRSRLLLQQLPEATQQAHPRLRLLRLMARLLEGRPEGVQAEFAGVQRQLAEAGAGMDVPLQLDLALAEAGLLLTRSEHALCFSPWATLDRLRERARAHLMHDRRPLAMGLAFEIFFLHRYGPADRCERRVRELEALYADGAYTRNSPWIWVYRARNALVRGDLVQAVETLNGPLSQDLNFLEFRQDSLARLCTGLHGQIAYACGDIDSAQAHFEALSPPCATDLLEVLHGSCVGLAACEFARGQAGRALERLQAARQLAQEESLVHLALVAAATHIDMLLRLGHAAQAFALAQDSGMAEGEALVAQTGALPWVVLEAVAQACWRLHLARDDAASAAQVAGHLLAQARRSGRALGEGAAQCMLACAHQARGDAPAARQALESALQSGRHSGAVQCALDVGAGLLVLLREWLAGPQATEQAAARAFAQQVVDLWEARFQQRTAHGGPHLLTPRETDVLRELARQHSTKQIARALALSPETVKHHLKNIFHKLQVCNREEALAEARRRAWVP